MRFNLALAPALALALVACDDPFAAEDVRFYKSVATGGEHTCAIATDDTAYCWGRGFEGQLGIGVKQSRNTPTRVVGSADFTDITLGLAHTCALTADGTAYCWGWNAFYERGNTSDTRDDEPVPVETTVRFRSLSAGDNHTCGIGTDSLAYCWGANTYGQLGDGTTRTRAQPRVVSGGLKFTQISAGAQHTCALQANGTGYCWGRNDVGQLGVGTTSALQAAPIRLNTAVQFRQIDAGARHTCAVSSSAFFHCWGGNEFGELGFGGANPADQSGSVSPHTISALFPVGTQITAGHNFTCALGLGGEPSCWGKGDFGQLGIGLSATNYHPQPVHLHFRDSFRPTMLAAGGLTHACAIADEQVYCWGTGVHGQLGTGVQHVGLPQRVDN